MHLRRCGSNSTERDRLLISSVRSEERNCTKSADETEFCDRQEFPSSRKAQDAGRRASERRATDMAPKKAVTKADTPAVGKGKADTPAVGKGKGKGKTSVPAVVSAGKSKSKSKSDRERALLPAGCVIGEVAAFHAASPETSASSMTPCSSTTRAKKTQ